MKKEQAILLSSVYFPNNKNLLRNLYRANTPIQNVWANCIIYSQQLTTGNELKPLNKLIANQKATIEVY